MALRAGAAGFLTKGAISPASLARHHPRST